MNKNLLLKILISILAISAIVGISISFFFDSHVSLYKDESTIGNTSGNLLNGGLFSEADDKIYFANPYDQNKLYSMDNNLKNVKKLNDDRVSYLNAAGKYIFYTRRNDQLKNDANALLSLNTTGLFRLNIKTKDTEKLYDEPTQVVCLHGNYIYYQHYDQKKGLELYSVKIDGSEEKKLLSEAAAPYTVTNDTIYYTGIISDHYIHSVDINGGSPKVIYDGNCTSLIRHDDYLYYMDMNNNYNLCRIALDGGYPETLIKIRIATYNISPDGETIYYQVDDGKHNGLYRFDISSGKSTLITAGNYNYLTLTNKYLFFELFNGSAAYIYNLSTETFEEFRPQTKSK